MSRKDQFIALIGSEIINLSRLQKLDWIMLTVVFDLSPGSVSSSAFAYLEEEVVPLIASNNSIDDHVRVLWDELKQPDQKSFVQLLIQIRRSDGKVYADFEYEDRSRWRISPANLAVMREALRPQWNN